MQSMSIPNRKPSNESNYETTAIVSTMSFQNQTNSSGPTYETTAIVSTMSFQNQTTSNESTYETTAIVSTMSFQNQTTSNGSTYETTVIACLARVSAAVAIFGIIGNILCVLVFQRMMRSNKNARLLKYLCYAGIANLVFFFPAILFLYLGPLSSIHRIMDPFGFLFGVTSYSCEMYLTIAVAVQRCLIVSLPLKYKTMVRERHVTMVTIGTCLFSVVVNIPHWISTGMYLTLNKEYNMYLFETEFSKSYAYSIYLVYVIPVIRVAIPMVVLIACNVVLVVFMRQPSEDVGKTKAGPSTEKTTVSVLLITAMSLIVHVMSAVNNIMGRLSSANLIIAYTNNFLMVLNSSANFVFFYVCGKRFRDTFKELFTRK